MITFNSSVGITRKDVAQYAKDGETHIKNMVLERVKEWAKEPIREKAFLKCEHAGEVYGEFQIEHDWKEEMRQEFEDMFFYEALLESLQIHNRL